MNRIINRIAKIRSDDHPKKMPVHQSYEYNLGDRKCFVTFYLDPIDQCGDLMIKLEDNNENVIDAINIHIPQDSANHFTIDSANHFTIEHDKNYVFVGSKEYNKAVREKREREK